MEPGWSYVNVAIQRSDVYSCWLWVLLLNHPLSMMGITSDYQPPTVGDVHYLGHNHWQWALLINHPLSVMGITFSTTHSRWQWALLINHPS